MVDSQRFVSWRLGPQCDGLSGGGTFTSGTQWEMTESWWTPAAEGANVCFGLGLDLLGQDWLP
jgi:hypothetical protein